MRLKVEDVLRVLRTVPVSRMGDPHRAEEVS